MDTSGPQRIWQQLRDHALTYPDAWEDHPWDESVVKVRKKIFVFLGTPEGAVLGCTVKLPDSSAYVLNEPWAEPSGYGLGRHGWVSMSFGADDEVPVDLLLDAIDESYRALAPKTLVKALDAR